ncbi:MAG: phosphotransferase family protein, partial [Salinisphaera sp.]|nr:phosphotransferase family protein [Salinisphaera sp.]
MTDIDRATDIRAGEEIDESALAAWLTTNVPELAGGLEVRQFPGGSSNLTYALVVDGREYVMRRPPFGSEVRSAHDMGREYGVLSRLHGIFDYAPRPIVHCTDESIIGAEFYVMERLRGVIVRRDLPAGMALSPAQAQALSESLLGVQAELHNIDVEAAGMADFGKPRGYVERQVRGWNQRMVNARTDDVPGCDAVMAWLKQKMPPDPGRTAIIHNDYKLDNVVLDAADPTRLIGVLDWEMATLGDPVMDFGCFMSYWVQADDPQALQQVRMGPTHLPGMLTRAQMLARYREKTGLAIDD